MGVNIMKGGDGEYPADDGKARHEFDTLYEMERALGRRADAEAGKFINEAEFASLLARRTAAEAESAELALLVHKRSESDTLAMDRYHHLYTFKDTVSDGTVNQCIAVLTNWARVDPECDLEIVFNSPGGGITAGLSLFDFIHMMREKGHYVTTTTIGMAASMAGVLLQAGEHRVMGREAWVLIHEASFAAVGSMGNVEDTVEFVKRIQKRILNIFAERSTLSAKQIETRWKRKDWWLDSDECLKLGFIDEIR